ncbi:hypothetical protein SAMN06298216_1771 [Spirosomataceae bacterium TFI 002]|nr:hypothetical protein SAMN06298216_1771 [Spirosomataceae bacterium TFI 002]
MLRDLAKNAFRLLPIQIQDSFRAYKFKQWEQNGRSIPPPQVVKLFKIKELQASHKCDYFIETGTYKGDMIYANKHNFKNLISVELSPLYFAKAEKKFANDSNVKIHFGDSGKLMPEIIKNLDAKALFWLDGHFSSGQTAQGELDCPIFGELDAIFSSPHKHVLLIDDARFFNGTNDYPTIPTLKKYIADHQPSSTFELKDDLITVIL